MAGRKNIGDELRRIADDYVSRNPADLAKVRAAVEARRRRRQLTIGGSSVAIAAAVALLFFSVGGARVADPSDIKPAESSDDSSREALRVTKEIPLGATPSQVASSEGTAYVTSSSDGLVLIVDLEEGAVVKKRILGAPEDIIHDGVSGSVWVTDPGTRSIHRLSSKNLVSTASAFPLTNGDTPVRLTVTGNTLRVSGASSGVVAIDLADETQRSLIEEDVIDIATSGGEHLWVLTATGEIKAIDGQTGGDVGIPPVHVAPREDSEITFAKGAIWYGAQGSSTMRRIDPVTGADATVELVAGYWDLDADRNGLWVLMRSSKESGILADIDPSSGAILARSLRIEGEPVDIATSGDGIWVIKAATRSIIHVNDGIPGEL